LRRERKYLREWRSGSGGARGERAHWRWSTEATPRNRGFPPRP
jgi:hypothetical protein